MRPWLVGCTDAATTRMTMTRRTFLTIAAGGVVATSALLTFRGSVPWSAASGPRMPAEACCGYVDHDGWMLTAADKQALLAKRRVTLLENVDLQGGDIAAGHAADADACSAWCLSDPDCRGFSYSEPTHPEPGVGGTCRLSGGGGLTPVSSPFHTSGTLE